MKVAVKDACVLIDLANGGLLDAWFHLGIETHTTNLVIQQLKSDRQWQLVSGFIEAGMLKVSTLNGDQMTEMYGELGQLSIGVADQTVLFLAMELDAILITGDRKLRLEGLKQKVEVRGLLWILDELISKKLVSPKLAAAKLRLMRDEGAFLPSAECQKRLAQWESSAE